MQETTEEHGPSTGRRQRHPHRQRPVLSSRQSWHEFPNARSQYPWLQFFVAIRAGKPAWSWRTARTINHPAWSRVHHVRNIENCLAIFGFYRWQLNSICRVPSIYSPSLQKECELQICVMFADAPTSIQSCKSRRNSSCGMGCTPSSL